jgi:hypothetical protein
MRGFVDEKLSPGEITIDAGIKDTIYAMKTN